MSKKIHTNVNGVKIYYYYLRDEKRNPYGCVCLGIDEDHKFNRGVSLCSKTDIFVKVRARDIARKRCIHAAKTGENSLRINYGYKNLNETFVQRACQALHATSIQISSPQHLMMFLYKSEHNVNCTPFEQEIVKPKPKMI